MSKYYRIAKYINDKMTVGFYKASTGEFTPNERDASRYHELDAPTVRDDVQDRQNVKVWLVED